MVKRNLVGVADARVYDGLDNLIFKSTTMLNTSIGISTGSTEIAGGKRNKLQNIYYHSGRLNLTLEDTTWNMDWVKANTGGYDIEWIVPVTESITLVAGTNNVTKGTPQPFNGSTVAYGNIEDSNGEYNKVQFTGVSFTAPTALVGNTVCIEYYIEDVNAESVAIPASIIPERVRVVLDVDIANNKAGDGIVGRAIIEIPSLQLSGAQTINMTSDGYSTVPLSGMALAFTPTGGSNACQTSDVYAVITTQMYNVNWYDNVIGLAILDGDFTITPTGTYQLQVIAITADGQSKVAPASGLTFSSNPGSVVTISGSGLVTGVGNDSDTSLITVKITEKTSIEANATVTLSN